MIEKILNKFNITNIEICDTFWKKFRGSMFSKPKDLVFVLNVESRLNAIIHTFFVFYAIDVYWLDKKFKIIDKRINLRPFRIAVPKKKQNILLN